MADPTVISTTTTNPQVQADIPTLIIREPHFGQRLEQMRTDAGYTINALAKELNCTAASLQNLESGDFDRIKLQEYYAHALLERICRVLEVPPDELRELYSKNYQQYLSDKGLSPNDDLAFVNDDSSVTPMRVTKIVILATIVVLVLLFAVGWGYRLYTNHTLAVDAEDYNLPELIPEHRMPAELLDVPQS